MSLNYCAAGFLQYYEQLCIRIFWNNWMYKQGKNCSINHIVLAGDTQIQSKHASVPLTSSIGDSTACGNSIFKPIGGGRHLEILKLSDIKSSIVFSSVEHTQFMSFKFVDHLEISQSKEQYKDAEVIICNISLHLLVPKLTLKSLHKIGKQHGLFLYHHATKHQIMELFRTHDHDCKHQYITVFYPHKRASISSQSELLGENMKTEKQEPKSETASANHNVSEPSHDIKFPPSPPSKTLCRKIVSDFCHATAPENFEEAGCCVCGKLTLCTDLLKLDSLRLNMDVLTSDGSSLTRIERKSSTDPILEIDGPIIDRDRHGYGNTRGVWETGRAGTGTVCNMPTRGYTATRTAVSRVCTGMRLKKLFIIIILFYFCHLLNKGSKE
jgi:hypothetical protein